MGCVFVYTKSCESGKARSMRIWRNWQTRTVQVRVNIVFVEVRILLSAPKDDLRVICSQVFCRGAPGGARF